MIWFVVLSPIYYQVRDFIVERSGMIFPQRLQIIFIILNTVSGIFLFQQSVCAGEMSKDILYKVINNSPELTEEKRHEIALQNSEAASRARIFPGIDANLAEDYVRGDTDSGFLSSIQLKIPLFKKEQTGLFLRSSQLERESYAATRSNSLAERLYRFRLAYYEAHSMLALLPDLAVKKKLLTELVKQQKELLKEKLKDSDDLDRFYNDLISVDEDIEHAKVRLGTARAIMEYLSNGIDPKALFVETSGEPPSLDVIGSLEKHKADMIASHPEMVKLRLELDKQKINRQIVSMKNMPEISGISSYVHDPRFNGNENQLFGGVEARWNLWDFGANKYDIEKEEALSHELEAKLNNTRSKRLLTIDEAICLYEASYKIWEDYKLYTAFRRKFLASVRRCFLKGEVSLKELVLERIKYINYKMASEKAMEDVFKKEATLIFTLGRSNI